MHSDADHDAASVRIFHHAASGGRTAPGALALASEPAGRGPLPYSADPHGDLSVPGAVLHSFAGRRSATAEDDGVHDAGLLRLHDVDLCFGAGALLVGGQLDQYCAAGGDESRSEEHTSELQSP